MRITSLFFLTTILCSVSVTLHPSSHNWPIESNDALANPLKIWTSLAFDDNFLNGNVPASVARIVLPPGKATGGPRILRMSLRTNLSRQRQKCFEAPLSAFAFTFNFLISTIACLFGNEDRVVEFYGGRLVKFIKFCFILYLKDLTLPPRQ